MDFAQGYAIVQRCPLRTRRGKSSAVSPVGVSKLLKKEIGKVPNAHAARGDHLAPQLRRKPPISSTSLANDITLKP